MLDALWGHGSGSTCSRAWVQVPPNGACRLATTAVPLPSLLDRQMGSPAGGPPVCCFRGHPLFAIVPPPPPHPPLPPPHPPNSHPPTPPTTATLCRLPCKLRSAATTCTLPPPQLSDAPLQGEPASGSSSPADGAQAACMLACMARSGGWQRFRPLLKRPSLLPPPPFLPPCLAPAEPDNPLFLPTAECSLTARPS